MLREGKFIEYGPGTFPFQTEIAEESTNDVIYFAIPAEALSKDPRTFANINEKSKLGPIYLTCITFIAEAVKNTLKFRGKNRGELFNEDHQQRIITTLTYVTKKVYENEQDEIELEQEELFDGDNIVAYVFRIAVCDNEINLKNAFADQIEINVKGEPKYKLKNNRQNGNGNRPEEMDGDEEEDGNPAGNPEQANVRSDTMDRSLDFNSIYTFAQRGIPINSSEYLSKLQNTPVPLEYRNKYYFHKSIKDNLKYVSTLLVATGSLASNRKILEIERNIQSNRFRISAIDEQKEIHHSNCFSLDRLIQKLELWGAHGDFLQLENWLSSDGGIDYYLCVPIEGKTTFGIDMSIFDARGLLEFCMPHCQIIDNAMLVPSENNTKTYVGEGENEMSLESLLQTLGIMTETQLQQKKDEEFEFLDPFTKYYTYMAEQNSQTRSIFEKDTEHIKKDSRFDPMNIVTSQEYVNRQTKLKEQGYKTYESVLRLRECPEGYKALNQAVATKQKWIPHVENLWMDESVALSPFAQMKLLDLIYSEGILEVADSTMLTFPKMLRVIDSTYLPVIGSKQNKIHMQIVAPPGTSKSVTLSTLEQLCIPKTTEQRNGSSAHASFGPPRSRRKVILFQELNGVYAPVKEPSGEMEKYFFMILSQLSEGKTHYSSTFKENEEDKLRETMTVSSDFTDTVIGNRNLKHVVDRGGPVNAMYDRFLIENINNINQPGRSPLTTKILQPDDKDTSLAVLAVRDKYQFLQRVIMEYGACISMYAVPLPDLSYFSDLAPKALEYMAKINPEIHFKLRNIAALKPTMYVEIIRYAAKMAICSPLNPNCKRNPNAQESGNVFVIDKPYETEECLNEMGKYAYSTMEIITFVLTEALYSFNSAQTYYITMSLAMKFANYFPMGHGPEKTNPDKLKKWMVNRDSAHANAESDSFEPFYTEITVKEFLIMLDEESKDIDYLGIPINDVGYNARNNTDNYTRYAPYDLSRQNSSGSEKSLEQIFLLNTSEISKATLLQRDVRPEYKKEWIVGEGEWINPNYVTFRGTFDTFASTNVGTIGNYQLSKEVIKDILWDLKRKHVSAKYLPLIQANGRISSRRMDHLQSLRYISETMDKFPTYKLPVVILDTSDPRQSCFHILVSYLETDPHNLAKGMMDYISYHSTRETKTIMGIPSKENALIYEKIHIKPIKGKSLVIKKNTNMTEEKMEILKMQFEKDTLRNMKKPSVETYKTTDLEEKRTIEFFKEKYPSMTPEEIYSYTPKGIWNRFYGKDMTGQWGCYARGMQGLSKKEYPRQFSNTNDQVQPDSEPDTEENEINDIGSNSESDSEDLRRAIAEALYAEAPRQHRHRPQNPKRKQPPLDRREKRMRPMTTTSTSTSYNPAHDFGGVPATLIGGSNANILGVNEELIEKLSNFIQ